MAAARAGTPVDVNKLRGENTRAYLVKRQDVEVRAAGSSLIQQLQPSTEIVILSSTGADVGTGVVVLGLAPTGVAPGQYNAFDVDRFGRITRAWKETTTGGGGGVTTNAIINQSSYEQQASFWISGGRVSGAFSVGTLASGDITAQSLTLTTPLEVASGGSGASTVAPGYVFAGPVTGAAAAPTWRPLAASDIQSLPWSHITFTPSTVLGYGIVDVYTRTQADQKFLSIADGTLSQYLRGDKSWAELTTAVVTEASGLYFTNARARAAISATGTNLSYSSATGVLNLTATPTFDSVLLNSSPIQANQAATKEYVDSAIGTSGGLDARDRYVVTSDTQKTFVLSFTPTQGSEQVFLNGIALFEGAIDDYTIATNTITLNASVQVTSGDVIHVRYKH